MRLIRDFRVMHFAGIEAVGHVLGVCRQVVCSFAQPYNLSQRIPLRVSSRSSSMTFAN
ncbi:MAG: hypothetical protein PVG99_14920 [Desulfobacteraceae bacterium]